MSAPLESKLRKWQMVAAGMGILLIIAGLLAHQLGLSASHGWSAGKLALVGAGTVILLVGILGRKTLGAYKTTAILLLNTAVLLIAVEFSLAIASRMTDFFPRSQGEVAPSLDRQYIDDGREDLPYFKSQSWSREYWREYHAAWDARVQAYEPYLLWRIKPFSGNTLNVGPDSLRKVPGAECVPGAYQIFTFGGSTMWGTGVPDWGTIPAFLQSDLGAAMDRSVCVVDYSEQGYVSTQGVIQLLLLLRSGEVPDLMVSYDGINDVFAAYESGEPGVHQGMPRIAARLEDRQEQDPFVVLLSRTKTYKFLKRLRPKKNTSRVATHGFREAEIQSLTQGVAQVYLGNYSLVRTLAAVHGFEAHFFWQTSLLSTAKPLTEEELSIRRAANGVYPGMASLYRAVDERISEASREHSTLHDLSDIFDQKTELIFIDPFHVTMEGNRWVATRMLEMIDQEPGKI